MQIYKSDEILNNKHHNFLKTANYDDIPSVRKIIEDVQNKGDSAVMEYSKQFGDGDFKSADDFIVSKKDIDDALSSVSNKTIDTLKKCIENVKTFAKKQFECLKPLDYEVSGSKLGHKIISLERVLCYAPGGNYPLPSSAVMNCVPAKVAGVKEVILTSPKIKPQTIVAAHLSGADKIYKIGGVQAISAFAYGTETITAVDKITGPGNKYVTFAKKTVFGKCDIDFLAGPSEVLVVADDSADPNFVAADLLAQCEHDKDARGYLICLSENFATDVIKCAHEQLKSLKTAAIAQFAFDNSIAIIAKDLNEAILLSNLRAPEHLELMFDNTDKYKDLFTNYGSMFIGKYCAEVFGDYCSGTNHVLPTNAAARYSGGLNVFDFVKVATYQQISKEYAKCLSSLAVEMAELEGLDAHGCAAKFRG